MTDPKSVAEREKGKGKERGSEEGVGRLDTLDVHCIISIIQITCFELQNHVTYMHWQPVLAALCLILVVERSGGFVTSQFSTTQSTQTQSVRFSLSNVTRPRGLH